MYVAWDETCSATNFAADGAAKMYEARKVGNERCDVTESTIPAAGETRRYGPEIF